MRAVLGVGRYLILAQRSERAPLHVVHRRALGRQPEVPRQGLKRRGLHHRPGQRVGHAQRVQIQRGCYVEAPFEYGAIEARVVRQHRVSVPVDGVQRAVDVLDADVDHGLRVAQLDRAHDGLEARVEYVINF